MSETLNILVLHRLGDPRIWRESMVEKELCLPKFAPEHHYLVHDFWLPLPQYVNDISFDGIILTQTFLGARADPGMRARMLDTYAKLLSRDSFKIALPQDDYTCPKILDDWLTEWGVDISFPVCSNHWDILYPRYSKVGRMKLGYTGYISEDLVNLTKSSKPIKDRDTHVAYRAANLSPVFGRLGQVKTEFGDRFLKASSGFSFKVDVSTRSQDTILGKKWYDFVQGTRCMLGVNSGSSLIDQDGAINKKVFLYLQKHPGATFEEVEEACFPDQDGRYVFTAISPRNLECGLFRTAQILATGTYGGFMEAEKDYISLEPDMSNFRQIAPMIENHDTLQQMTDRCREKILSFNELRYSHHVADLLNEIRTNTQVSDKQRLESIPLIQRYQQETEQIATSFWNKKRRISSIRSVLGNMGLRKIKYFIQEHFNPTSAPKTR